MTQLLSPERSLATIASELASRVAVQAAPHSPQCHLIPGAGYTQLFIPNGSRLYPVAPATATRLQALLQQQDETGIAAELTALGLDAPPAITDVPLESPDIHAISLAIAQKCNMGCSYCYADQGDFGGPTKNMTTDMAKRSIDLLLKDRPAGSKVQLTFLGGEPLINRQALQEATVYAAAQGRQRGVQVGFSITTNGTLLRQADAAFFEAHGFAVTVSLDGIGAEHDQQRPMKNGSGSYERIIQQIQPLLQQQQRMQVSARVTVTPANMDLARTLETFVQMGFHSVGFSPLLRSSNGQGEMSRTDLEKMLQAMVECGLLFERYVIAGQRFPFLNMVNALKEIAKGTHRPYPCGAGAGYLGVSADGALSACHRFVNEPAGNMGHLNDGVDPLLQNNWLAARHVHQQTPCTQCWARYLCGGGCHHEVLEKGRTACDYIRGWLHYTLQAHERLTRLAPDWYR
ncbi:radical SAM/SPASM domain-containing protein [Chitinophaga nivalis]|uniref:Radical SAM protein n=1 Tax=Chitinophaga nivalis TaxID=2991709 RepID=A0ABT3IKL5_9BACT|nr:radical SAM protein [Chitinophaga nivalis]MCW3465802.1 radical SAM protein [Chitinophaga nivalis]MCW3484507.1 radical SAM protein [Chitinophaga nivalis]